MEKVMTQKTTKNTIYQFEYGLPGFEHLSKFEFLDLEEYPPFKLFRSTETPEISMIVMDGKLLQVFDDITFPGAELSTLNLPDEKYMRIFVILRIDEKTRHFVANTKAPLVLNTYSGYGKQIILDDQKLSEEHKLEQFN
jgi:flagellar assembly factor FliW